MPALSNIFFVGYECFKAAAPNLYLEPLIGLMSDNIFTDRPVRNCLSFYFTSAYSFP